jgi:hypothetical protein
MLSQLADSMEKWLEKGRPAKKPMSAMCYGAFKTFESYVVIWSYYPMLSIESDMQLFKSFVQAQRHPSSTTSLGEAPLVG